MAKQGNPKTTPGQQLASIEFEIDEAEERFDAVKQDHKATMQSMKAHRKELARQIMTGQGGMFDGESGE